MAPDANDPVFPGEPQRGAPEPEPAAGEQHEQAAPKQPAPARRKRRWGRRILLGVGVIVVLVLVLVGLAPTLVSTEAGRDFVLGLVNDRILGTVELGGLSVGWGGPARLDNVRVLDPERREVLKVARVSATPGVWRLLTQGLDFGEVRIDSPHVLLHLGPDNELSLARAFQMRKPGPPSEPSELPEPRGTVVLERGSVRLEREGGAAHEVNNVAAELRLATLDHMTAALLADLPEGTRLKLNADVIGLVSEGKLGPLRAAGELNVKTEGAIELGPLTRLLTPETPVDGRLTLDIAAAGSAEKLNADYDVAVQGLQTALVQGPTSAPAPLDIKLKGQAQRAGEALDADAELASEMGTAHAKVEYRPGGGPLTLTGERLIAAVLTGEKVALPQLKAELDGALDLARLRAAVPGLLKTADGREITSGRVEIAQLALRGGAEPGASGKITVQGVTATGGAAPLRLEPVTVDFDAVLRAGVGLDIARAVVQAAFARVDAKGTAADLRAEFSGDLGRLQQELGPILDLGAVSIGGRVAGRFNVKRVSDERVELALETEAKGLRYAQPELELALERGTLRHAGALTLANGELVRYEAASLAAELDGQVQAAASGAYDFQRAGFDAQARIEKVDLRFLASRAEALKAPELARYGGLVALETTARRGAGGEPIALAGKLNARELTCDGKPLVEGETTVVWRGVQVNVAAQKPGFAAEAVQVAAPIGSVEVNGVRWQGGPQPTLEAGAKIAAELAKVMPVIGAINRMEQPPAVAGRLALDAALSSAAGKITARANGGVDELAVGTGEQTYREARVDVQAAGALDQGRDALAIERVKLAAAPLSAELTGTIEQVRSARVLALKGSFDANWAVITKLLHEFVPATAKTVAIEGTSASSFEVTGPVSQPDAQPPFRGLKTGAPIKWSAGEVYGVKLGAAELKPALADGKLTLPPAKIPTGGGGAVNLTGTVDFAPADPLLSVPEPLQALDRVPLTPDVAGLLSWVNPIFKGVVQIEGRVNLRTREVALPLGETLKQAAQGQGVLDLRDVRLAPGGFLGELTHLMGVLPGQALIPVEFNQVELVIRDGRVHYDNFAMMFPNNLDLKFYGSVGFDSTLDLVVSLPVGMPLVERLGLKAPGLQQLQPLSGLRIDIPIAGTREQPKLDFSKVDKEKLLKEVLKQVTPGGKLLEQLPVKPKLPELPELLPGLGKKEPPKPPPPPPERPERK